MKCKECKTEIEPGRIAQLNAAQTQWKCSKCSSWNDYEKQTVCEQSELNDGLSCYECTHKPLCSLMDDIQKLVHDKKIIDENFETSMAFKGDLRFMLAKHCQYKSAR